ncbi:MAG: hypothetical protein COA88_15235 [Kordia sp.]|nr:MAG: hypothetical protein COA88_15235 [Kordia sp.]
MKKICFIIFIGMLSLNLTAQVGIGTTTPEGALDVNSLSGFIPPRVALTSTIIETPVINPQGGGLAAGTMVWNTDTTGVPPDNVVPGLHYWNGIKWIAFAGSPGGLDWSLSGNSGTIAGVNFIGTTDVQDLRIYTNNINRMRVRSDGTIGVNSIGTSYSQVTIIGSGANDGVATTADDTVSNGLWARNVNSAGTAIIGATNSIGGYYPTAGAGVAGSGVNSSGISGMTGNGAPNNSAHNGNSAGYFSLDSDNDPGTNNSSAFAFIAGKDEQSISEIGVPSRRILYGGYFVAGTAAGGQSYSYVGLKYNHNDDITATGGTDYKIVGNGTVSTLIRDEMNRPRVMFCPEAPEVLFVDYGTGKLINGKIHIKLDKILARSLKIDKEHPLKVFIQLEGNCKGVYVTNKSSHGFDVNELMNGTSNVDFSWHIVANRADRKDLNGNIKSHFENLRLPIGPSPLKDKKTTQKKLRKTS